MLRLTGIDITVCRQCGHGTLRRILVLASQIRASMRVPADRPTPMMTRRCRQLNCRVRRPGPSGRFCANAPCTRMNRADASSASRSDHFGDRVLDRCPVYWESSPAAS